LEFFFFKRFFEADTAGEKDSHIFKELIVEMFTMSAPLLIGDFIPWLNWVTTVSGFKARMNKAKANIDSFLQTFLEFKKSKLMQQKKIQKKPQAAGSTNEEEHADEEQQFDPEADLVDALMAQRSEDGKGNLSEDSVKGIIQVIELHPCKALLPFFSFVYFDPSLDSRNFVHR
jgi:hypothetical protein